MVFLPHHLPPPAGPPFRWPHPGCVGGAPELCSEQWCRRTSRGGYQLGTRPFGALHKKLELDKGTKACRRASLEKESVYSQENGTICAKMNANVINERPCEQQCEY